MIVTEAPLPGLLLVEQDRVTDDRGYFARTFDRDLFWPIAQMSTSFNASRGTLRGLHFQADPYEEHKLVRCTRGAVFDVAVDLRPESPTIHRWFAAELSSENGMSLAIPPGFAHGFLTLQDDTEVLYAMDTPFASASARGVRWDDAKVGIEWPADPVVISEKDGAWPAL